MSMLRDNLEVRACYEADTRQLLDRLRECLAGLTAPAPDLNEFTRAQELVHTLRGASALVQAVPIADVCGDYMRLFEVADSFKHSAIPLAVEIFAFAESNLEILRDAIRLCLDGRDDDARALCANIRSTLLGRWGDYFYASSELGAGQGGLNPDPAAELPPESPAPAATPAGVDDFLDGLAAPDSGTGTAAAPETLLPGNTEFLASTPAPARARRQAARHRQDPTHTPVTPGTADDFLASVEMPTAAPATPTASTATAGIDPTAAPAPAPEAFRVEGSAVEADLLPFFYEDALSNLEGLEGALERWQADPSETAALHAIYRHTHTIKGAANSTGLSQIGAISHAVEDLLEDHLEKRLAVAPALLVNLLYEWVDGIKRAIGELQASAMLQASLVAFATLAAKVQGARVAAGQVQAVPADAPPAPETATPAPVGTAGEPANESGESLDQQTIRISAQRLDAMMNLIGELVINRTRLDRKIVDIARLKEELNFCKSRLLEAVGSFQERFEYSGRRRQRGPRRSGPEPARLEPGRGAATSAPGDFSELEFDRYDEFNILARTLVELGNDTSEIIGQLDWFFGSFSEESAQFNKTTTELQNEVTRIRMVPLTFLFRRLRRAARDAAQREGKEIEFIDAGGDTQLDKVIVDQIYSPPPPPGTQRRLPRPRKRRGPGHRRQGRQRHRVRSRLPGGRSRRDRDQR